MIEALQAALAQVPGALLVIVFLGGPTAAWIIFRVLNASARPRPSASATGLLWVCASCRSANDTSRDRCYRCGVAADMDALEVVAPDVDPVSGLRPVMSPGLDLGGRTPVAVGPGKPDQQDAGPGREWERGPEREAGPVPAHEAEPEPEPEPVLAGGPAPKAPRPRRTAASGKSKASAPASAPAKSKASAPASASAKASATAAAPPTASGARPKGRASKPAPAKPRSRRGSTGGDGAADGQD
jgi:hypothetical protein